ncbi:MAG: hypothetical protein L6Q49_05890 [Anaerolineales bacterium]|nr:hypothetical protein [Anaerolineales bacterium]
MKKDMFGVPIKKKVDPLEITISRSDKRTIKNRVKRLKYLQSITPYDFHMLSSVETYFLFEETRLAFVNGAFVATMMLSQAFIERRINEVLVNKRIIKRNEQPGLKALLKICKEHEILNILLIKKIDHLRQARNPFTHLKPLDHPYTISNRIGTELRSPEIIVEEDAREAISLMYTVLFAKF